MTAKNAKTVNKNKPRKNASNLTERISIKCSKKEKAMVDKITNKRFSSMKECVLKSVEEQEKAQKAKDTKESNSLALICSVNNILSDIQAWELKHGECEEITELKQTIERRISETWEHLHSN